MELTLMPSGTLWTLGTVRALGREREVYWAAGQTGVLVSHRRLSSEYPDATDGTAIYNYIGVVPGGSM